MKNLLYLTFFFTFSILACNNTSTEKNAATEETQTASENANWETFWKNFQSSVSKNAVGSIVGLTALPLKGNFFTSNQEGGLSRAGLIKNYGKIFEPEVAKRMAVVKENEWREVIISKENEAKNLGVPMNEKVKLLQLNYVFNEGKDNQTESTQLFYFAKIDGEYKWCSMFIAG